MQIIAHRGVSTHFTENTLDAFENALPLSIAGIEFDVHQVGEQFFVFHDFNLQRLTGVDKNIGACSAQEIVALALINKHGNKASQKIPTLAQVFELVQNKHMLNIEVKHIVEPMVLVTQIKQHIERYNAEIVVSSFDHFVVKNLQHAAREVGIAHKIKFAGLIAHLPLNLSQYAIDLQVDIAAIDAQLVNKDFVTHAHMHNLPVWCYTVNDKSKLKELIDMGVDAVFCNDPAMMQNVLSAYKNAP